MVTLEKIKSNGSYEATKRRMELYIKEFELLQKERATGLTDIEREELGATRIANALKDGFYC